VKKKTQRLLLRLTRWVALGLLMSVLPVVALRFIDPIFTTYMLRDFGDNIEYRWVDMEQISAQAALAVVAAEDQRFPEHHGFDLDAIQKALLEHDDGERLRGASTITQQTAKNLFLWPGRSFIRKALEAWYATWLEIVMPKRRILEIYLNVVELGPGVYGVEAASRRYFGCRASQLSSSQAALLAAVLPNPRKYHVARPSLYVRSRQIWIRRQMYQLGDGYLSDLSAK